MRSLAIIALATLFIAVSASAQPTVTFNTPQHSAFGVDPVVRITTTFRTVVPTDGPAGPDAKAQEAARRALYGVADGECALLSETFKAECRLNSLSMTNPVLPASAALSNVMSATAIYELKPRAPAR